MKVLKWFICLGGTNFRPLSNTKVSSCVRTVLLKLKMPFPLMSFFFLRNRLPPLVPHLV